MEFLVLGPLEVVSDHQAVAVRGSRRRLLLATLLLHRNVVVSVDHLVDVLFGDDPPSSASGTVQSYVSRLRSDLCSDQERLQTRPGGYVLRVEADEIDSSRFERQVADALRLVPTDPAKAADLLLEGLCRWQGGRAFGEFLDDLALQAEGTRLEEIRQRSLEGLIDARLALGDYAAVIELVERCIIDWPLRERFRAQQMLALYSSGRQPEALRVYQRFRAELGSELGLEPSAGLVDLENRILLQDPGLGEDTTFGPAPTATTSSDDAVLRGNLPAPVNSFIGRDDDVARLAERLATTRLLTLTGPGGVGKTRLAFGLAATVADTYPDGVWVCDLAAVREPGSVADAVTAALDVQPRREPSTLVGLVEVLKPRRMLVVLDNCEHVLGAVRPIAEAILRGCPGVQVLATSREPLTAYGESVWPVGPLELPSADEPDPRAALTSPAVRLFLERATAAQPTFSLTPEAAPPVVEICRRLDGVPLAIELAAALVRSMTPIELANRLDQRFTLLTSAGRSGSRHQTLLATVEWSYEMLGPAEQSLFDRLSIFAGKFTAADIERVCVDDAFGATEISFLPALIDKSMVMADTSRSPTRFSLLETLREFGRVRLDAAGLTGELQQCHTAHAVTVVAEVGSGLDGPDEAQWARRMEDAFDDLRVAHRRALALGDADAALRLVTDSREFAFRHMRYELFSWAEATTAMEGAEAHPLMPVAIAIAGYGRFVRGDLGSAMALAERSVALEQQLGVAPCGLHWRTMGNVFYYRGLSDQAAAACQRMVHAARTSRDEARLVHALYMASVGLASAARAEESTQLAEEALTIARRTQHPTSLASALYARAITLERLDPGRAASMLEESIGCAAAVSNRWLVAFAQTELVTLAGRRGDLDAALRLAADVIDIWYRAGDWANQWLTMRHVASVLAQRGDYEDAAVIHGAVRVASAELALPIEASDLRRVVANLEQLRDALGPGRLSDAEARGAAMRGQAIVAHVQEAIANRLSG